MEMLQPAAGEDRLSALPDDLLTSILSYLSTDESVRTSALARRWRRVHRAVPVIDLSSGMGAPTASISHMVSGVLLDRESAAPIRSFRVAGFRGEYPSKSAIDQWILTADSRGAETIDLDLDLAPGGTGLPLCPHVDYVYRVARGVFEAQDLYIVPRRLFAYSTLRHLRLVNCQVPLIEQAQAQSLPLGSLETLSLRRIKGTEEALQSIVSYCPRLAELTVEECPLATHFRLQQPALHLRSFTVRCCHSMVEVFVNAPFLRFIKYKGNAPGAGFSLSVTHWERIEELSIDICEPVVDGTKDMLKICEVEALVERCSNLKFLRLSAQPDPPPLFPYRPRLPGLMQLELSGSFRNILDFTQILDVVRNTGSQVLTFVLDQPDQVFSGEILLCNVLSDDLLSTEIEYFSRTLVRINVLGYSGQEGQKRLAEFLLRKAMYAEEMYVSFAASVGQGSDASTILMNEMTSWRQNPRMKITFAH